MSPLSHHGHLVSCSGGGTRTLPPSSQGSLPEQLLLAGITERAAGSESLQGQGVHGHSTGEMQPVLDQQEGWRPLKVFAVTGASRQGGSAQGQDLLQGAPQLGQAMDLNGKK